MSNYSSFNYVNSQTVYRYIKEINIDLFLHLTVLMLNSVVDFFLFLTYFYILCSQNLF